MRIQELIKKTEQKDTFGNKFYLPDKENNIQSFDSRVQELKKDTKTVVFLIDSLNYFEFEKHFKKKIDLSNLQALTSSFPTGTHCAFSSIFLNAPQQKHGVYGIAFYIPEYNGIYQISKSAIVDSYNKVLRKVNYLPTGLESVISGKNSYFVHLDDYWFNSSLWNILIGNSKRVKVPSSMNYENISSTKEELDNILLATQIIMDSNNQHFTISFIDYDGPFHKNGVKTEKGQELIEYLSEKLGEFVCKNKDHNFVFMADHGQIDLKNTFEIKFEEFTDRCYASRGGLGRTLYFYSKQDSVYEEIKERVGDRGLVLRRNNPLLSRIYGYDVSDKTEIGDVVAIAIKKSFPSFGWNFAAEHGGLSKEEVFVPFLKIGPDVIYDE